MSYGCTDFFTRSQEDDTTEKTAKNAKNGIGGMNPWEGHGHGNDASALICTL